MNLLMAEYVICKSCFSPLCILMAPGDGKNEFCITQESKMFAYEDIQSHSDFLQIKDNNDDQLENDKTRTQYLYAVTSAGVLSGGNEPKLICLTASIWTASGSSLALNSKAICI